MFIVSRLLQDYLICTLSREVAAQRNTTQGIGLDCENSVKKQVTIPCHMLEKHSENEMLIDIISSHGRIFTIPIMN